MKNVDLKRLPSLDLLRLFSALCVVLFHYTFRGAAEGSMSSVDFPSFHFITKYGAAGVDLFFVISGFVIAGSAQNRSALQFTIARFIRLYPAYMICMSLTALCIYFFGEPRYSTNLLHWAANLTFFAPVFKQSYMDGVYWTLVREIIFYAWVALFIHLKIFNRYFERIVVVWILLCVLNESWLNMPWMRTVFLTELGPYFMAGMIFYKIWQGRRDLILLGLLMSSFLLGFYHCFSTFSQFENYYHAPSSLVVLIGIHIGIFTLFAGALVFDSKIPNSNLIRAFGGMTYPLYLLHEIIGFIFLNRVQKYEMDALALGFLIIGMLLLSWLVWIYLERPLQKRVLKFEDKLFGFMKY